jgi:four helix bundle protein
LLPQTLALSRDHRKLRVFQHADALAVEVYHVTSPFPSEERYGLQAQVRRAAVSVAVNIVEGSARRTTREYVHFLNVANGSAAETLYLLSLAHRLSFLPARDFDPLRERYSEVLRGLQSMIRTLESA